MALHIGHRKSIDLDFFGHIDYSMDELKMAMESVSSDVQPINSTKTMRFYVVEGVKIDVVNYPYSWIGESVIEDGLTLAGIEDIAAMKLAAITNRGTKKDFIDLFFLLKKYSLSHIIGNMSDGKGRDCVCQCGREGFHGLCKLISAGNTLDTAGRTYY